MNGTSRPAATIAACAVAVAGLALIPPICDEIGVDWPPGSLNH